MEQQNKLKIVVISGATTGVEWVEKIIQLKYNISTIFSYDEVKKKFYSDFGNFDQLCEKYKIPQYKISNNINDNENVEIIKKIKPDLILVLGWSQLLKNELIKIPKIGVFGSHPTILPKYRGRAPIPWTIIKGLKKSGLTFFWIDEGIDDGDILDQNEFIISDNEDATSLMRKITEIGKNMLEENLANIQNGIISRRKQNPIQFIENWVKRTPEDGHIDWSKSNKDIHTLIRATTYPYPGAYTIFKNKKIKIWKADILEDENAGNGKIISVGKMGVKISTGVGSLIIKKISVDEIDNQSAFDESKEIELTKIFDNSTIGESLI
tara:strand:+ start:1752 stop:2720 length:969 start_codon:yes stop_codon:yes gene_type:complete